jgi:hypothetical protein
MFFDIFKDGKKPSNVVPFPVKEIPMPVAQPPAENPKLTSPANYLIGVNPDGAVQLSVGEYARLTMTDVGVVQLIEDLSHYIRHTYAVEITKLD